MKNPIPQDWDGESWKRYCVCWPDSELWTGLLLGFLSYCTRGRSWHENTGVIKEAQAIGWEIWENNVPLEGVAMTCQEADNVAKAIMILTHAITGTDFDGPADISLEAYLAGYWNFSHTGLANRIGPTELSTSALTIQATLDRLNTGIEGIETLNTTLAQIENVVKAIMLHSIAMTGQTIDFTQMDVNAFFTQAIVDFTQNGLANRIGPQLDQQSTSSLSARMDQVREAIEALSINVNVENGTIELPGGAELANISDNLEEIRTVLETRSIAETVAQNTNFEDLVAAVAALQLQCETIVNTTNLTQNISCGGSGTGGTGDWPAPESPQTTTPEDEAGDPPPGFESWSEFRQYQCDMAYLIIDQMISDLSIAGLLAAGGATVGVLVPLLIEFSITPIGWVAWLAIAGLVIYCFTQSIEISLLSQLLLDNKEEFVCALLSGTNVSSSISHFSDLVDSKVDEAPVLGSLPEVGRHQVKQLIVSYASIDSINRLYEKSALPPPGGNDCSACEGEQWWSCLFGTEVSHDDTEIVIQAVIAGDGNYSANLGISTLPESWNITLVSGSFSTPSDVPESVTRWSDEEGASCGVFSAHPQWNEVLAEPQLGAYPSITAYALRSNTAFTIRIERT